MEQFEMFNAGEMSPVVIERPLDEEMKQLFPDAFEYVQVYIEHGAQGVEYLTGMTELREAMDNPDFSQWAVGLGFDYQKCQTELSYLHRQ